ILHEENQLMEIVKLIGSDVLPDDQKLVIEIAKVVRVGYLQQNAFHPDDTFVPFDKQYKMLKVISYLYAACKPMIQKKFPISAILKTGIFDLVIKMKYDIPNNNIALLDTYFDLIDKALSTVE
ncbi:MAG: V-type ATP synthase subunit A, partial [Anaerorhabdus sp.]